MVHPKPFLAGPTCLGVIPHPAVGIRLPELFLPGILAAYQARDVAGGLMLSFGRETAPEAVIQAPPGAWEITRGHTGTSIREYLTQGAQAATAAGVTVEMEADHLIVIGSATAAVQRIAGYHAASQLSPEALQKSLDYNYQAINEAAATGVVGCFTTDTSDLFWLPADHLRPAQVRKLFAERFAGQEGQELLARYREQFTFPAPGGRQVQVSLSELQTMRLALKFQESLRLNAQIYHYCRQQLGDRPFSFEISLDETAALTHPRETLFYLMEWRAKGLPCHFFAPNIGFHKRADFDGDLAALERRVRQHHAIAQGVAQALLSIHSGSGTTPYSGKGPGAYEALLAATGGQLKYKISGVYYELLMELLAAQPAGSVGYTLYRQIFDAVLQFLRAEVKQGGTLAQPSLIQQLEQYDREVAGNPRWRRHPRADFFRFHSYLALNLRDEAGSRPFREGLIRYVRSDPDFRAQLNEEVKALTMRLIDGLKLAGNRRSLSCES